MTDTRTITPVAEALAAVDRAAAELDRVRDDGEDDDAAASEHLDALLALTDVVRSHIGARAVAGEPGEPAITWRWKPQPGVELDGVWVPYADLEDLQDHPYDSLGTGNSVLLNRDVGRVLKARGLASAETRGGWHAGPELAGYMASLEHTPTPELSELPEPDLS